MYFLFYSRTSAINWAALKPVESKDKDKEQEKTVLEAFEEKCLEIWEIQSADLTSPEVPADSQIDCDLEGKGSVSYESHTPLSGIPSVSSTELFLFDLFQANKSMFMIQTHLKHCSITKHHFLSSTGMRI